MLRRPVKFLLAQAHDHIFLSKNFTCFEMGPSLQLEEGLLTPAQSFLASGLLEIDDKVFVLS
jgi:hypothetical protein